MNKDILSLPLFMLMCLGAYVSSYSIEHAYIKDIEIMQGEIIEPYIRVTKKHLMPNISEKDDRVVYLEALNIQAFSQNHSLTKFTSFNDSKYTFIGNEIGVHNIVTHTSNGEEVSFKCTITKPLEKENDEIVLKLVSLNLKPITQSFYLDTNIITSNEKGEIKIPLTKDKHYLSKDIDNNLIAIILYDGHIVSIGETNIIGNTLIITE